MADLKRFKENAETILKLLQEYHSTSQCYCIENLNWTHQLIHIRSYQRDAKVWFH